jgi:MinD superfamily P-loop ATPase
MSKLVIRQDWCTHCDQCRPLCPHEGITKSKGVWTLDPTHCTQCGLCVNICAPKAIQLRLEEGETGRRGKGHDYGVFAPIVRWWRERKAGPSAP